MLIDGEIEIDGELHVGHSAYELRCMAQSASHDFSDLIIEVAQLERSIQSGIQRDRQVRAAMLLRARLGLDEYAIEQLLQSSRPGYRLLERGVELVRRHERGRRSQLLRVRANRGESDTPVCWRCLKEEVPRPGDWCGCIDKELGYGRRDISTGPGSTYDPAARPPPGEMTEEERLAEIELLTATQERAPIPGGENYRKKVSPVGTTIFDADDLRRADRSFRRGGVGPNPAHHDSREQVPSK